ncbi:MAG: hypothetical protein ACOY3X_02475 [Pseudomonadota bacterium]
MAALSDETMADISGQQGIALNLEFRINAQADGSAVPASECPAYAGLAAGESCRLSLTFADRSGIWAVMKNYRGIIKLNNIWMDAVTLPNANSAYRDLTYIVSDPNGDPAVQLRAGNWANAYNAGATSATYYTFLNQSTYQDFTAALTIDKISAEYDCGAAVNAASGIFVTGCSGATAGWDGVDRVPGYLRNAVGGAALSMRMANGITLSSIAPNAPAQIRLDGRLQLSGY